MKLCVDRHRPLAVSTRAAGSGGGMQDTGGIVDHDNSVADSAPALAE